MRFHIYTIMSPLLLLTFASGCVDEAVVYPGPEMDQLIAKYSDQLVDLFPERPEVTAVNGRHVSLRVVVANPSDQKFCVGDRVVVTVVSSRDPAVELEMASALEEDVYEPKNLQVAPHSRGILKIETTVPYINEDEPAPRVEDMGRRIPWPDQKDVDVRFVVSVWPEECSRATPLTVVLRDSEATKAVRIHY